MRTSAVGLAAALGGKNVLFAAPAKKKMRVGLLGCGGRGNGALDYTFRRAEEFSLRAREIMSGFPASAHRDALALLAEFVLNREH